MLRVSGKIYYLRREICREEEALFRGAERAAEAIGSGVDIGQDDAPGCAVKKVVKPSQRRPVVSYMHDTYRVSERRACRVARVPVSTFRYDSRLEPRTALRLRIREIAQAS